MQKIKYLSCFSGIGGFELGIIQSYEQIYNLVMTSSTSDSQIGGHLPLSDTGNVTGVMTDTNFLECIGFSEIDKHASAIYKQHFPNHHEYGDITKIDTATLPDFDILVGGFPCQAFSIAGKRRGFDDTRGTLFFELARILREKQPGYFVFENVKGLLSHDSGNTFRTIMSTIAELGYDAQWQVLNSKNHGVPQNRERVFIVGHLRGKSRPEVFPFGENDGENQRQNCANTITATYWKGIDNHGQRTHIGTLRTHKDGEGFREMQQGICPTIPARAREDGSGQPVIYQRNRGHNDGGLHSIAPTMTGRSYKDNNHLVETGSIRRLTPVECERLQGFPDGWTETASDTQRYKCLGNAVTVNVIADIFFRLFCSIIPKPQPQKTMKILFFDTETTGFPKGGHLDHEPHIVELAMIFAEYAVISPQEIILSSSGDTPNPSIFSKRYNPGVHIPQECSNVHGIYDEDVKDAEPFWKVWTLFKQLTEEADIIVGHNVSYDMKMIYLELRRLMVQYTSKSDTMKEWFNNCERKLVCTQMKGTPLCEIPGHYQSFKWPKLQELHKFLFGVEFEDAHNALADIEATKRCFEEMVTRGVISVKPF